MKVFGAIMMWVCVLVICAECPNLEICEEIVVKLIAGALCVLAVKLIERNMSDDELNEKV